MLLVKASILWTCKSGVDQNWSNKLNWDNGVPTAASNVVITNACPSTMGQSYPINNLGIMAGGEVIVGGGITLTINGTSITNNGQLSLNGSNSGTATLTIAGNVTLSGNGRLVMSNTTTLIGYVVFHLALALPATSPAASLRRGALQRLY